MNKSNSLIFFGNERLATATTTTAPVLKALVAAGYKIEAVITGHTDIVSRQKRPLEIGVIAQSYNIPVLLLGKLNLAAKLEKHRTEAAILVAFGGLIPRTVIDLFPKGIINVHPSLLPKLRGPTPIETTILEGLTETGVSLMKITSIIDAGPVYAQEKIDLSGHETKLELAEKLGNAGAELLINNLEAILAGRLLPKVQDETKSSHTNRITKEAGSVDWSKPPALLEREVRAFAGWPKSQAKIHGNDVIITKARIAKGLSDGDLVMPAGTGWLEVEELIAPSGRTMSGADFLRGYAKPK